MARFRFRVGRADCIHQLPAAAAEANRVSEPEERNKYCPKFGTTSRPRPGCDPKSHAIKRRGKTKRSDDQVKPSTSAIEASKQANGVKHRRVSSDVVFVPIPLDSSKSRVLLFDNLKSRRFPLVPANCVASQERRVGPVRSRAPSARLMSSCVPTRGPLVIAVA